MQKKLASNSMNPTGFYGPHLLKKGSNFMVKNIIYLITVFFLFSTPAFTASIDTDNLKVYSEEGKFPAAATTPDKIVRRAAFDIGSGQIKVQVSDVNLMANKIVNVLFTDAVNIALREDLVKSLDGRLSIEIQNKTVDAIAQLMQKAKSFYPEAYHAVATESLRLAKNGAALVDRIKKETDLTVTIVTQEEEGILGFLSAVSEANVDPNKVVSWDLGGGSFQITTRCGEHYSVYQGRFGKIPMKYALLKIQGKNVEQTFSPNPISKSQANQAIQFVKDSIKNVPIKLSQKLNQPDVIVLGIGINPLWRILQCMNYDSNQILRELERRLNLEDESIRVMDSISVDRKEVATYAVSNLILASAIMEVFQIHQVQYVGKLSANAIGALLSPEYWK